MRSARRTPRAEPVLVLGGGSNLLVADEGFDGTVVPVGHPRGRRRGVRRLRRASRCGSRRASRGTCSSRRRSPRGWSGVEALSGIPGSTRGDPDPERRCLRPGGRRDRRPGPHLGPAAGPGSAPSRTPTASSATAPRRFKAGALPRRTPVRRPRGDLPAARWATLSAPVRYAELARALGVAGWASAPRWPQVRDAVLALRRGKGMVLDPADHDTWSAGSFFTNPVLDVGRRRPAARRRRPRWPTPDGRVKTSAAWLIEHAGFGRGYGLPGPASLSTKHTARPDQPRRRHGADDLLALARRCATGCARPRSASSSMPEPVLVGCTL